MDEISDIGDLLGIGLGIALTIRMGGLAGGLLYLAAVALVRGRRAWAGVPVAVDKETRT